MPHTQSPVAAQDLPNKDTALHIVPATPAHVQVPRRHQSDLVPALALLSWANEQAAMKVLYLVATARRPNRENLTGKISNWKQALNILTIHYGDRLATTS